MFLCMRGTPIIDIPCLTMWFVEYSMSGTVRPSRTHLKPNRQSSLIVGKLC